MAISPQEAAALVPDVSAPVDALEKKINAYILCECAHTGVRPYEYAISPDLPDQVLEELMRRYRKAGWKVTVEPDQRNGPFLRFTA